MALDFSSNSMAHYREAALKVARRTGLDYDSCEDVAQESVIQLYRNRDLLSHDKAVFCWLATTARRLALVRLAEQARNVPWCESYEGSCVADVFTRIDKERTQAKITQGMKYLPEKHRSLLAAIYAGGLSYTEVSLKLGLPLGSIGPTRSRALERLMAVCEENVSLVA